jgi:hypothetical protein
MIFVPHGACFAKLHTAKLLRNLLFGLQGQCEPDSSSICLGCYLVSIARSEIELFDLAFTSFMTLVMSIFRSRLSAAFEKVLIVVCVSLAAALAIAGFFLGCGVRSQDPAGRFLSFAPVAFSSLVFFRARVASSILRSISSMEPPVSKCPSCSSFMSFFSSLSSFSSRDLALRVAQSCLEVIVLA